MDKYEVTNDWVNLCDSCVHKYPQCWDYDPVYELTNNPSGDNIVDCDTYETDGDLPEGVTKN